ncbi:MAG TPA: cellulase family glycosylhydrolase [Candidatus Binatia bacterium]|jgi:endoglucanase|nr:cellulase family glycosylhydrolase [Candidatus Binatia bacterium]
MNRRKFIKTAAVSTAAVGLAGAASLGLAETKNSKGNPLTRWRGFNLTDFNSPNPAYPARRGTTDDDLNWMVDWGFDFIRLPMAYPRYVDFDRSQHITPAEVYKINEQEVDKIEAFVRKAQDHGLHVSLNLHRAPGYCINAGFYEPYDLWKSKEAQEAFFFHWGMWAKRFKSVPASKVSFDLLNEPSLRSDMNDQHATSSAIPGELYRAVAKGATDAIRAANPGHLVLADGNKVGNLVTPELKDLNIAQSCRGYFPGQISHYKAPWANKDPDICPTPVWPGTMNGQEFGKPRLETYYQSWIELARSGVGVHCGECGCWNKTPHSVFLGWFGDVLDILTSNHIGYALWNFRGDFGILDSRREDVDYQDWHGHKLDARLLELLKGH